MTRLHEVIEVPTPRAEAFDYVADFSSSAEWDPGVESATKLTDGPVAVGTKFEVNVKTGPTTSRMEYVVEQLEPPTRVVLRGEGTLIEALDEIEFADAEGGTRITYTADISFKGPLGLAEPLMKGRLEKIGKEAVEGMRKRLGG